MALITCHECASQVSTDAKACPSCGAPVKIPYGKKHILAFASAAIFIIGAYSYKQIKGGNGSEEAEHQSPKTEQEVKAKELESLRINRTVKAAKLLRESLRNPDSLKWEAVLLNEDGSVICMEYRAENGFGGYSKEILVINNGEASQSSENWNKACANKNLHDMKSIANVAPNF